MVSSVDSGGVASPLSVSVVSPDPLVSVDSPFSVVSVDASVSPVTVSVDSPSEVDLSSEELVSVSPVDSGGVVSPLSVSVVSPGSVVSVDSLGVVVSVSVDSPGSVVSVPVSSDFLLAASSSDWRSSFLDFSALSSSLVSWSCFHASDAEASAFSARLVALARSFSVSALDSSASFLAFSAAA